MSVVKRPFWKRAFREKVLCGSMCRSYRLIFKKYYLTKNAKDAPMNIIMTDTQKYRDLKRLVETSYDSQTEAENVWESIRWLILTPDQSQIRKDRLEYFEGFLKLGLPLCHMDFYINLDGKDPFFDTLKLPYVSPPCCELPMGYASEIKRHFRFFFVNPDESCPENFSFMNKLALKNTCILITREDDDSVGCESDGAGNVLNFCRIPLHSKNCADVRFVVQCSVDPGKLYFRFKRMLEVKEFAAIEENGSTTATFSAVPFAYKETNLQKRFNSRMNRNFAANAELRAMKSRLGMWKWSDVIKAYLF